MVRLGTRAEEEVYKKVAKRNVEEYRVESDGIGYPDTLVPSLGWTGCGFAPASFDGLFNPFAGKVPPRSVVDYYMELLPEDLVAFLQWTMPQYGADDTDGWRGNVPLAEQGWRPSWMSKPQYLAFGALRAFPNQQARKMCIGLREKVLPLDQPAVHTLLQMAADHLGELDVHGGAAASGGGDGGSGGSMADNGSTNLRDGKPLSGELFPKWHTDLWVSGAADVLCAELQALLNEVTPAPRRHGELSMLAELAGYLGERHAGCLAVARGFGEVALKWGEELEVQLADNGAPVVVSTYDRVAAAAAANAGLNETAAGPRGARDSDGAIRSRQRLFYLYALLCYGGGPLSVADARNMVELSVMVSYLRVFEEEGGRGVAEAKGGAKVEGESEEAKRMRE
eukprot:jgi/Mesvir1/21535/Mv03976-RA.1